jgi:hypothetical protein
MKTKITPNGVDLGDYVPGQECECASWHSGECSCNVDWTDRRVYEYRAALAFVEKSLRGTIAYYHLAIDADAKVGLGQWIKRVLRKPRRRKAS